MIVYGGSGALILWRLESRRRITALTTGVWLDLMMVPFYCGAGVAAYLAVASAPVAALLGWANACGALYLLLCSWRRYRKNGHRRQWWPNLP